MCIDLKLGKIASGMPIRESHGQYSPRFRKKKNVKTTTGILKLFSVMYPYSRIFNAYSFKCFLSWYIFTEYHGTYIDVLY